jgi:hypothetical protein
MNSSKVDRYTRKLVLQYRWGLLPTNRLLHKIGKAPTNQCPLCGQEDGGHHAISGCKELSAAYTRRHNDAGTEILEAISRGKEAGNVFLSDVGYTRRKAPSEVPEGMQPHRFMRHMDNPSMFSHDLAEALKGYRDSVPDIIMLKYFPDNNEWVFDIVEIKYCRDTDPMPQQERAAAQHAALKELILAHEPTATVRIVPLLLGASGIIYESFLKEMRDLGVGGSALTSLARRLHHIAVRNLKLIWTQRRAILMGRNKRPGKKGKRDKGRRPHKQHSRPTRRSTAQQGTKRLLVRSEPDHRKRRKKR